GGSVAGLLTSMQLAGAGHRVTVLEREPRDVVAPPVDAPASSRPGAPQAVQGHGLLSRAWLEIQTSLPQVSSALLASGIGALDLVASMPARIADRAPRPGDHELVM